RGENVACYPKVLDSIVDKKFLFKLSTTKKNLTSIDQVYNVVKISDDDTLIGVDQSVSNLLPASCTNEAEFDVHSAAVVSLSKDSGSESIFKCGLETPGKGVVADSNAGAAIGRLYSLDVQGSTTKPLKYNSLDGLYRLAKEQVKPLNGLDKVREWTESRGLKRAAVNNAPRVNTELMISLFGLSDFFHAVIIGGECEH
ncbi:hypothetical protein S245_056222, partial [Arachis hypogaea]